jgi:hypothetical protein
MNYDDDNEFYENYSEFDEQVNEFKKSLLKNVKQEFIEEMNKLKKENLELQEIKNNFESIESQYLAKKYTLEREMSNALLEAKRMRLSELLDNYKLIMYKVDYEYSKREKCNNCDENRQLHFKSPSGRDITSSCDCSLSNIIYIPSEHIMYEFKINNSNKKLSVWYKLIENSNNEEYFEIDNDSSHYVKQTYNPNIEFAKIEKYEMFFERKEDCQKYCDWLNKNEKEEVE